MINPAKNERTDNTFRFDWMQACKWTCKEICSTFWVPRAIGYHIQQAARTEQEALEIARAHRELCNGQVGF